MSKEEKPETIFDYNVTDREIKELFYPTTGCLTIEDCKSFVEPIYAEFGGDFFRYADLFELFRFRGQDDKAQEYETKAKETEYWKLKLKNPCRV